MDRLVIRAEGLRIGLLLLTIGIAAPVRADAGWVERIVAAYRQGTPIETEAGLAREAAAPIQHGVVAALESDYGGVFGYKAGLTSLAARQRLGVDAPILGTLLDGMILVNGARISTGAGVHLLIEADLLVRVKDRRINDAATVDEAFRAIDRVAPMLEVPDVIIASGQPVTGPILTAVNGGARYGIKGESVPVTELTRADLSGVTVTLTRDGEPVGPPGSGQALMGDPLNAVLWIVREARRRGISLEAGDWLSLGSLTPPEPVSAGERYRGVYRGLGDAALAVEVSFIP